MMTRRNNVAIWQSDDNIDHKKIHGKLLIISVPPKLMVMIILVFAC